MDTRNVKISIENNAMKKASPKINKYQRKNGQLLQGKS